MKPKKMKVKNRQHKCTKKATTSAFCYFEFHFIVIILVLCLPNVSEVSAYFNRSDAVVNRHDNGPLMAGRPTVLADTNNGTMQGHRSGKFLFDSFFGIEQTIEDDEVSESDDVKTCNCGKCREAF